MTEFESHEETFISKEPRYRQVAIQEPYCCVPASLTMVLHERGVAVDIDQVQLGNHLGLVVPPEETGLIARGARTDKRPASGWGTQIYKPEYSVSTAFKKLGIPFELEFRLVDTIASTRQLAELLEVIEEKNMDAILCFNRQLPERPAVKGPGGHVAVFDRISGNTIRIIDSSPKFPGACEVSVSGLFQSMKYHTAENSAGIWLVQPTDT